MNRNFSIRLSFVIILLSISFLTTNAQPVKIQNAAEMEIALQKLNVLGSVLYIAAHPDDENTALMAYLSKGEKYRTGYLSLTRGDGGQNLIGAEKGVEIGMLRTQELLQARRIDGAEQFFTRAIDFGFSKSPEESFSIWNKEKVLEDVVWVIRKFKPDVIVLRFPVGSPGGHGHHTASSIIASEAFEVAADPNKFPDQLKYVQPWKAKRLFWNSWRPSEEELKQLIKLDVGTFNPLLGKSYTEIAAESRSMHKSQGFGATPSRGSRFEYFQLVNGDSAKKNILEGVNTSWTRVKNGGTIKEKLESIIKTFDTNQPAESLPKLFDLLEEMNKIKNNSWVEIKKIELQNLIRSCAGLWMEVMADDYSASPGDKVNVKATFVNRVDNNFKISRIEFPSIHVDSIINKKLENNQPLTVETKIRIPDSYPISQPYWLEEESSKGLFKVSNQQMIGIAENPPSVPVKIYLDYAGKEIDYTIPLLYRWNDRVEGEIYRPFEVRPPVTINPVSKVVIFSDDNAKEVQVKLSAQSPNASGVLQFKLEDGWKISPQQIPFSLEKKYGEQIITFTITPPQHESRNELKFEAVVKGKTYGKSLVEISYPHIVQQVYFPESNLNLVKLDVKKIGSKIGYVMGSGDEVPDCLRDLGYQVTQITDEMLQADNFEQYDAIVTGIRAYNTRERLKYDQPKLLEYVKNGGTLIVQYNVSYGLLNENIGPFPFKLSQDRITDEDAKMNFVNRDQQLVNFPNKITEKDFNNWIQERGLYFANQWDTQYQTVFTGHDSGETDLPGGTLIAKYGKGIFIYTGLSFFRELPAGIPGAFRIFANMISAGKYNGKSAN
jgi:LmbE family N-acetylglucosaminyl deacetylase